MTKYSLSRFTEDHGNWWIKKLRHVRIQGLLGYSNFLVKISAFIKGIELKEGCRFFGITHFDRFSYSQIQIGNNCTFRSDKTSNLIGINHRCIISTHDNNAKIKIGDHCGFSGVSIGAAKEITIGNNVLFGANSVITDFDWHEAISNTAPKAVIIHDNVWIGLNAVVLKGVEIGENSIIGANSLVLKSIPPNVIAGGNPCKVLKVRQKL